MRIVKAIYAERTITDIVLGKTSPVYWKDIVQLQIASSNNIKSVFNIESLPEYALKAFFGFSNSAEDTVCISYQMKNQPKKNNYETVVKTREYKGAPSGDNNLFTTCGIISGINDGKVYFLKSSEGGADVQAKVCSKCGKEHYSKFVDIGDICSKTQGCNGTVQLTQRAAFRTFLIGNIKEISRKGDEEDTFKPPVDFSKFLSRASTYLLSDPKLIDNKVFEKYEIIKERNLQSRKDLFKPEETMEKPVQENESPQPVADINNNMISLAKMKKKKNKQYKRLKRIWNPQNDAVYDYWASLYGGERNDYARDLIKNN